jgi:lipopolysaccharide/colanic/teichoic acid biosynthesis glycosyltransferase
MKNPWLRYITLRVGLFIGFLALMLLLGFDPFFSAIIAAVVSLSISLIFFSKQRAAVSEAIYRFSKNKTDKDSDAEDAAAK